MRADFEHTVKLRLYVSVCSGHRLRTMRRTASITFPLTLRAPVMNAFCPFNLPSARFMKVSAIDKVAWRVPLESRELTIRQRHCAVCLLGCALGHVALILQVDPDIRHDA